MNIFVLSRNVNLCARYHFDRHVVKMPLETAQLLSTSLFLADSDKWALLNSQGLAYKPTHQNHPCSIWTRQCINNYLWLAALGLALCREYSYRYSPELQISIEPTAAAVPQTTGKVHKCQAVIEALTVSRPALPRKRCITPFALVVPDDCNTGDPVASYRCCYIHHKHSIAGWTRREAPEWYAEGLFRTRCT